MARQNFSVPVDKNFLDTILDQLTELEIADISKIINQDSQQVLKQAAIKFLSVALETQSHIINIENLMMKQKQFRTQIKKDLNVTGRFLEEYENSEYSERREEIRSKLNNGQIEKFYRAAFQFHEEINAVLGQQVKTVIVLEDSTGTPLVYSLSQKELFENNILSFGETSKTARIRAQFQTNATQMKSAGIQALEKDNFNNKIKLEGLNQAYKDIIYRYNTYKRLVLWQYPMEQWNKSRVTSRGDIAEAYASFLLQKKSKYDFKGSQEKNIHYFMVLGVAEVDNISGLLQGDISDGQYEYAVKSAGASYMNIKQMIVLAEKILRSKNFSVEDLRKYKEELKQKKQRVRNSIEYSINKKIEPEMVKIMNDLTN